VPFGKVLHRWLGKRLYVQVHLDRFAIVCRLHGSNLGDLVLRAPAQLTTGVQATQAGFIHLAAPFKNPIQLALVNGLYELVVEPASGAVAVTELATPLQWRDVVLGMCGLLHAQKPHRQRRLADSIDDLAEQASLTAEVTASTVLADVVTKRGRTDHRNRGKQKTIRPMRVEQSGFSMLISAITRQKDQAGIAPSS